MQVEPAVKQAAGSKPGAKPWRVRKTVSYLVAGERREYQRFVKGQYGNAHLRFATFEEADAVAIRFAMAQPVVKNETTTYAAVKDA